MLAHAALSRVLPVLGSALFLGCVAKGPDAIVVQAGPGIKVDPSTLAISVDPATVPMVPACINGQFVTRTTDGKWQCLAPAVVTDAATLGGNPSSYYLAATAKAADSSQLNGHPDAFFLSTTGTAANSSQLNGHPDAFFLTTAGTAVNSANLNGHADTFFLAKTDTAANSANLGGHPAGFFLPLTAKAADSALLNGLADTAFLRANGKAQSAINADQLGGIGATSYVRKDDLNPQTVQAPLIIGNATGTRVVLGGHDAEIFGSKSASGNFYLDADSAGSEGRIYLNSFSGKGVAIANGAGSVVASFDNTGNMIAASYNGVQIFKIDNLDVVNGGCNSLCVSSNATCIAAKMFPAANTAPTGVTPCATGSDAVSHWSFSCICVKF